MKEKCLTKQNTNKYIVYKYNRNNYIIDRFEETYEKTVLSVPFLVSEEKISFKDGEFLLKYCFKNKVPGSFSLIAKNEPGSTITTKANISQQDVSRYLVDEQPIFNKTRLAKWYDFRVDVLDKPLYMESMYFDFDFKDDKILIDGYLNYYLIHDNEEEEITITLNDKLNFNIEKFNPTSENRGTWKSLINNKVLSIEKVAIPTEIEKTYISNKVYEKIKQSFKVVLQA